MSIAGWRRIALVACLAGTASAASAQPPATPQPDAGIAILLRALDEAIASGTPGAYLKLLTPSADREAAAVFAAHTLAGGPRRAAVRERDRRPLTGVPPGDGYRLTLEILFESGNRGRLATWQIDVRRAPPPAGAWGIESQRELSAFENLYRLSLDAAREFAARDLEITAEDVHIRLASGFAFVVNTDQGVTALVLVGKGEAVFTPRPASERGQIKIFSGSETLREPFDACFVRINPGELDRHLRELPPAQAVNPGDLKHAEQVFVEDAARSFTFDLGDLSPGPWSILPSPGDFLAEIHTRHDGALTYARSPHEPEAVALFDRAHRHYLARYASEEQLRTRGEFYSDDDRAEYRTLHYDVEATFAPDRGWIEGRTRMTVQVRAPAVQTLEVRLADSLAVRSVAADGLGRLLAVRVRDQNMVMITLPETALRDAVLTLTLAYAGRLPPQSAAGPEAIAPGELAPGLPPIAPGFLYSARTAWYAQSPVTSYATARLRLTVPQPYTCIASGVLVSSAPVPGTPANAPASRQFLFDADRPVPYLACLIGTLVQADRKSIRLSDLAGRLPALPRDTSSPVVSAVGAPSAVSPASSAPIPSLDLTVESNPGEQGRARVVSAEAADIVRFYTSLLGSCPYPDLTIAVIESELPGGQSPAYMAVLDEQVAMSRLAWRNDPASFPAFPEFFIAHEIAHQWWGQAVGQKNYHESWLSEAFAQYFAALYSEHAHGHAAFEATMREMQRWALRDSEDGPVYLGPRIGQLKNDPTAVRAVVYDKGAVVLDMLRRLLGDAAFFRGLGLFYERWRFKTAGSDDLRQALESASATPLAPFFDRWVYHDTLPHLAYTWQPARSGESNCIDLRLEQAGDVFPMPMTVTIAYADGTVANLVIPIADRVVVRRIPVAGRVRRVTVNGDDRVPAVVTRR